MAKRPKPAKPAARKSEAPSGNGSLPPDESADIAATRAALKPALDAGVHPHRLASACGAHPDDLRGFLEGRITLTAALRARLRAAVPAILESLDPYHRG